MEFKVDEARIKRELRDAKSNTKYLPLFGRGGVFLDLGANIGQVSIDASDQFDKVVAVEAHPHTFRRAQDRIQESGKQNISIMLRAVHSKSGQRMFVSTPGHSTGATAREDMRLNNPPEGYYKPVYSIDINDLIAAHSPRVIKMDIEGAEYEVINAMRLTPSIEWLTVEFHMVQSVPGWDKFLAARSKIEASGFKMRSPKQIKMRPDCLPQERYFVCVFERHHERKAAE